MFLDLTEVSDGLTSSKWWNFIRVADFAFQINIPKHEEVAAEEEDVFIHKEMMEIEDISRKVLVKRYHTVLDGELIQVEPKDIRELLATKLSDFIIANSQLPFGCELKKIQKSNRLLIFNYLPNDFDKLQLKIQPESLFPNELTIEEMEDYIRKLPKCTKNPLGGVETTFTIQPIEENRVIQQVALENGKSRVYITNGFLEKMDIRKTVYMGNEKVYYLIYVKGGIAAPDNKKSSIRRDFDYVSAKCSKNLKEKVTLEIGDEISFSGTLKNDSELKWILQNVKKITNHSKPDEKPTDSSKKTSKKSSKKSSKKPSTKSSKKSTKKSSKKPSTKSSKKSTKKSSKKPSIKSSKKK
ncbi:MAG: hypothetical protein ACTSYI_12540 [Promethearchaeota archaeon]